VKRKHVKDRHLDIPAEANRDNHINFTALEEGEVDPRDISGGEFSRDNSTEKGKEQQLNIVAGNVRYKVKITPFISKDNQRYHISINDGPTTVFSWDDKSKMIKPLDEGTEMTEALQKAISGQIIANPG